MKKMIYKASSWLSVFLLFAGLIGCNNQLKTDAPDLPVDQDATTEKKALYQNLKMLSGKNILFGHHDALVYGVGRNHPEMGFCNVKDVIGSYPAVYGWDIGHILDKQNVDSGKITARG
jgi:hypothetical protein